jgi:glycine/D-amino acid oxidase-like deaminating enzyme
MEADMSGARPGEAAREAMGASPAGGGPYRGVSFWLDTLPEPIVPRPSLAGDLEVDVAIVGAGFTGLWTAYYLRRRDPHLRVAVVEAEVAGFGASGRNGGWCSALFAASWSRVAREQGVSAATAMRRAMQDCVDEVGRIAEEEGIDAHFAKGGTLVLARNPAQLARARAELDEARSLGIGPEDLVLLDRAEAGAQIGASKVLGALYTPHCASLHPGRLVRGLAGAAERRGVSIYERTPAVAIGPHRVVTPAGTLRAEAVVRATEGYTARLPGTRRLLAPVYSLMIATAPLADAAWEEIGLSGRTTFSDERHLLVYGQRTADGRLAFGGRGAPYHFGSSVSSRNEQVPRVHEALAATLADLLPAAAGVETTHRWGGPLGVPRDWFSAVDFDRRSGLGWAGGYVGDGVSTANLAGRTLADLITGTDSDLTRLAWVGRHPRRWEPEPLRFLGLNGGVVVMRSADRVEERTGRPARRARWFSRLVGG